MLFLFDSLVLLMLHAAYCNIDSDEPPPLISEDLNPDFSPPHFYYIIYNNITITLVLCSLSIRWNIFHRIITIKYSKKYE